MSTWKTDLICAVYYLSSDRRSKRLPTLTDIAVFLRGSDLSRKKIYTHKYDVYGQYVCITNDEVKKGLDDCVGEKLVACKKGYSLTGPGIDFLKQKKPEALVNPYIKRNDAVERGEDYQYIGKYACYYRLDVFKKKSLNELLDRLEGFYSKLSPFSLNHEQIHAWSDCYHTLKCAFEKMPRQYEKLYVIFEYVMPQHRPNSKRSRDDVGIRSDVILVSQTAVLVLEFKQRDEDFEGFVLQAKKYKTRLEKYHSQSKKMKNYSLLVLTKATRYLKKHDGVTTCSKDFLPDLLQLLFETDCEQHPDIKSWLHSPFDEE